MFDSTTGITYDETEDLLNMFIPEKYEDVITDDNGNRMIIKDIYVENFKSYKGRHQLGPLHKNLTMVVGPNGSGKSNVIDALLFVFGFRAKQIRTSKLNALIYNNDDDSDSCTVEITFQEIKDIDADKYEVNVENQFVLARTAHKDGSSHYFLNSAVTSTREVREILRKAGIDMSHNRFLILQGEVEAISQMKPTSTAQGEEGMLEYIENIVGTNRFVIPIAKLAHRIKTLEYQVSSYSAACRRHQGMLNKYTQSLIGAIAYIDSLNNIHMIDGLLNRHNLATALATKDACNGAHAARQSEYDRLHALKEASQKAYSLVVRDEASLLEEIKRFSAQKLEYGNLVSEWEEKNTTVVESLKRAIDALAAARAEAERVKAELEELATAPQTLKTKLDNLNTEYEQTLNQKNNLESGYTQRIANYDIKVNIERAKLAKLNDEFNKCSQEVIIAQGPLSEAEAELNEMEVTDLEAVGKVKELKEELKKCTKRIANVENLLPHHRNELAAYEARKKEAIEKMNSYRGSINLARTRKYDLDHQISEFHEDTMTQSHSRQSTKALKNLHAKGGFPGFLGRLGDMAWCPEKFDNAISTVFGGALDWHIVQTKEDSTFGINFLIDRKLPRSTFYFSDFCRDVNHRMMNAPPESFPATRLFDQINFDNENARRVLYKTMGDILVVENIQTAVRLDKKHRAKFRYTTFDGTFIDQNGSISGGGNPASGRIRTTSTKVTQKGVTQEDVDRMVAQLRQLEKELVQLEAAEKREQAVIEECEGQISNHKSAITRFQNEIDQLTQRAEQLEAIIPEMESKIKKTVRVITQADRDAKEAEVAELKKTVEPLQDNLEKARNVRDQQEAKVNGLFDRMVGSAKESIKKVTNDLEKLEAEIAKERVNMDNIPQLQATLRQQLIDSERLVEKRVKDLEEAETNEKNPKRIQEGKDLKKEYETATKDVDRRNKEYDEICTAKIETHKRYQEDYAAFLSAEELINANRSAFDQSEMNIFNFEKFQRDMSKGWHEPEDLNRNERFVRLADPEFERKVQDGYLVLPDEIVHGYDQSFKATYEAEEDRELDALPAHQVTQFQNQRRNLEANLQGFRNKFSEIDISNFAATVLLQMHDIERYNTVAECLRSHRERLYNLRHARLGEFNEALTFLGTTTQMLYQLITNGGDASLKFVEEGRSDDPFVGGIKFSVRPAKKSWKLIENLSGGEKTLASLCFVFAMHHFRPTPLYVMDEIDAALDLNNVRLIADYIKTSERTRNAQFIIISLRNQMFEVGSRLVGIYKTEGCTRNIIINPQLIENWSKCPRKIIEKKLKEMARKDRGPSEEDDRLSRDMSKVTIAPKPKRRLGELNLRDFGCEKEDSVVQEVLAPMEETDLAMTVVASDDEFYSDGEEKQAKKKPKKKVAEEFNYSDDDESDDFEEEDDSPGPSQQPSTSSPTDPRSISKKKGTSLDYYQEKNSSKKKSSRRS